MQTVRERGLGARTRAGVADVRTKPGRDNSRLAAETRPALSPHPSPSPGPDPSPSPTAGIERSRAHLHTPAAADVESACGELVVHTQGSQDEGVD